MEVILLQDVDKVGLRGEVVNVARGYARNFLLPRRLAEPATPGRVADLERRDEQRARHEAASFEQGQQIAEQLNGLELRFDVQAGPTGTLFGSVTATNVADEIWRLKKIRVDRRKIDLPDSIKRIGRYSIPIEVFTDVTAEVRTLVVPEGGELPPEEELAAMEAAEAEAAAAARAEQQQEEELDLDELDAAAAAQDPEVSETEEANVSPAEAAAEVADDEFDRAVDAADEGR